MDRQTAGAERAGAFIGRGVVSVIMAWHADEPVEQHENEESECDDGGHGTDVERAAAERDRFREQVEERDADHGAGAEAEDEMQLVFEAEREPAAEKGGDGCRDADKEDHRLSIEYLPARRGVTDTGCSLAAG